MLVAENIEIQIDKEAVKHPLPDT